MTQTMQLSGPDCVAVFAPDDGGRLQSFRVRGRKLLVSMAPTYFITAVSSWLHGRGGFETPV